MASCVAVVLFLRVDFEQAHGEVALVAMTVWQQ